MIEAAMYVALGFCTAGLIGLAILPAFYRRASRLTEEALRAVNPASYAEVRAAQDQERARQAVELRRVETRLDTERERATRFRLDAARLRAELDTLQAAHRDKVAGLEAGLAERGSDRHAIDLLTAEIGVLQQKLQDAEKALAESWTAPPDGKDAETKGAGEEAGKKDAEAQGAAERDADDSGRDWLPATDTMALATITALEAEVATLKVRLQRYEPRVAGEVAAARDETAKTRLADLESQLVDTESQYVAAQAEVTRLSLMLDAARTADADPDEKLQQRLKEMTGEITSQRRLIHDRDKALERLTGQVKKLSGDLAAAPELKALREEFRALTRRLSTAETVTVTAAEDAGAPGASAGTVTGGAASRHAGLNGAGPDQSAAGSASRDTDTEMNNAANSSDIASAAEALVSRIVASSRTRARPDQDKSDAEPADANVAPAPRKSRTAKAKKKDVA